MIRFFHAIIKYHFKWEEVPASTIVSQSHKNLKESPQSIVPQAPRINSTTGLKLILTQ